METDTTGHGTRDTGHDPRPVLRAASPDTRAVTVPSADDLHAGGDADGTRDVPQDAPRDTVPSTPPKPPTEQDNDRGTGLRDASRVLLSRWMARRAASRAAGERSAEQAKILEEASRAARDAERDRERDALSRAAESRRVASRGRRSTEQRPEVAPIPMWMRIIGVWADRTFGAIPLLAPLIVSGYFTMHVFTDEPLAVAWGIALCITLALEGGVWKLSRIYEKTLLEGDSTIGIRVVIGLYLALISGMIFGHAYYLAWKDAAEDALVTDVLASDWSKWAPAAGVAVMSFLGVMVWSKQARYQHRVKLREQGMVDPRAPKFSTLAWILHPGETFAALRHSVKYRMSSPIEVVDDLRLYRAAGRPPIWPIPQGFAWINGTLEQVDPLMGRDVQDAEPLPTGQRPALDSRTDGTPARVIDGTSRPVVPQLPAGQNGTRDTGGATGQHGTLRNEYGTPTPTDHGTRDTGHGTRDADGTRDSTGDMADLLKYAEHLIAVTEAYPDWHTGTPPAVRKITAAINDYRRRKDGGSYNSNATSAHVQQALVKMRERPELLDLMRGQQGDTSN